MGHFIHYAQYCRSVQALAAFINVHLPFQRQPCIRVKTDSGGIQQQQGADNVCNGFLGTPLHPVSAVPYIRRLVATGFDSPSVLCTIFGEHWNAGIGHILHFERRNYLFAAKSDCWLSVKLHYDMAAGQEIPTLGVPEATEWQLGDAEQKWSQWLAMQGWMLGPRAPDDTCSSTIDSNGLAG